VLFPNAIKMNDSCDIKVGLFSLKQDKLDLVESLLTKAVKHDGSGFPNIEIIKNKQVNGNII
jgi:hypothetical protein